MANKFYNISGRYQTAKSQAQEQVGLEITDELVQLMVKAGLGKAAENMVVGFDWDIQQLDDGVIEVLVVELVFDASDTEPTLEQGEKLEELIEETFNPAWGDEGADNIVFTNEPVDEDGHPQHIIQFQIDLA